MADMDTHRDIQPAHYIAESKKWLPGPTQDRAEHMPSSIRVVSWNIDCMRPEADLRLDAALSYIQHQVFKCRTNSRRPEPCSILLQGVLATAFNTIINNKWVQNFFVVIPPTTDAWPKLAKYGTVTLLSRSLHITKSTSLQFSCSESQHHATFVDVKLSGLLDTAQAPSSSESVVTLRIANTHLDPLPDGVQIREKQLKLIADTLIQDGLFGGIVGGDFNAVSPNDSALVESVGLWDAWSGDDEGGFTWGYQPRSPLTPGRLDKLVYTPRPGFFVDTPKKIAVGKKYGKLTQRRWISDHYALLTKVQCVYFASDALDRDPSDHGHVQQGLREQRNIDTCSLNVNSRFSYPSLLLTVM
ncbi:Endonuclease/exonuclease/phosphatase [Suillus bovinus]|uniref:Endonuclease/exonuclease/phosphatase n=1 Tax=Suillus bovinus TaxID=48563 RepID=UPI001B874413|nr:Endonuclease/exonuclease/phosphatase [Suillus bovinus]KAG2146150.1 Endonuclease/exonuclease/phosphatase [Suillus bovinus]